jgi:hypothetical protein
MGLERTAQIASHCLCPHKQSTFRSVRTQTEAESELMEVLSQSYWSSRGTAFAASSVKRSVRIEHRITRLPHSVRNDGQKII